MGSLNVNRRLFKRSAGISMIALIALLTLLVATGTVFAASPIAGVGGFTIAADTISGSDFELIPALTSTNTGGGSGAYPGNLKNEYQKVYPAAQVWLGGADITGLNLSKNISLAAIASTFGIPSVDYVKVEIKASGTVHGDNLLMNTTDIAADDALFGTMVMMENLDTQHPNKLTAMQTGTVTTDEFGDPINTGVQIGMSAATMAMTNGVINTHSMKADSMDIPGMTLQLKLFDASNVAIDPPYQNANQSWN